MSGRKPFVLASWEHDFLGALADALVREDGGGLDRVLLVFPHARPARHLRRILAGRADLPKPCLLPTMSAAGELLTRLSADLGQDPRQTAHNLDRAGLLAIAAARVAQEAGDERLLSLTRETRRWLPWGLRLAALLEDFFQAGAAPADVAYADDSVPRFAAVLLARLRAIYLAYIEELDRLGLSTPGYDAKRLADAVAAAGGGDLFPGLRGRRIILAGFYGLSGVEDRLFKHLWRDYGAEIWLHTDLNAARAPAQAHWACAAHTAWLENWQAAARLLEGPADRPPVAIDFYQGYDLHSQLAGLVAQLPAHYRRADPAAASCAGGEAAPAPENDPGAAAPGEGSAIILPDTGLLMPLLHHLPRKNVNISMGYPLNRSALARLLESVFHLQETRRDQAGPGGPAAGGPGVYHWRAVLDLFRHPYLRMLEEDGARPLQAAFNLLEKAVRSGPRFLDPRLLPLPAEPAEELRRAGRDPATLQRLLGRVLELTLTAWENVPTLRAAAQNLAELSAFLQEQGRALWPRFLLDSEFLFRLADHLVPELQQSVFADEPLDRETLFAILREALAAERAPFEAEPLEGLQVLGLLETRLLSFERVFILDATDDRLPGASPHDPLLPDSLRRELGLPGLRERELAQGYTFHRLIRPARQVSLFYQTGGGGSGLMDDKKLRSRFVEELLWAEEQERRVLLAPGDAPLHGLSFAIVPAATTGRGVRKSEPVREGLEARLREPLSATALDVYLRCPVQFYYAWLARLEEPPTVREGDDPKGVGEFLHQVLQEFFTPLVGRDLPPDFPGPADEARLRGLYRERLAASGLPGTMPYASLLVLEQAGLGRLLHMLRQTPLPGRVLCLEHELRAPLEIPASGGAGRRLALRGRMDRVDLRPGESGPEPLRMILDYKSGRIPETPARFWSAANPLWPILRAWTPLRGDPLPELAESLGSLQLPVYIYLNLAADPGAACNAAFVDLARSGAEKPLFTARSHQAAAAQALRGLCAEYIPDLLGFVLRHLLESPGFEPHFGAHCAWCPYAGLCRRRL